MLDAAAILRERETKALRRLASLRATVASLEAEVSDLQTALKVLTNLKLIDAADDSEHQGERGEVLNDNQSAVLEHVPSGENGAVAPRTIIKSLELAGQTLNGDYVRTVLWRAAQKGLIRNKNGFYWRDKEEAPDAETSEASESTGLAGRGGSDSHPASESSSLSRSTPSQATTEADWEDDVPF